MEPKWKQRLYAEMMSRARQKMEEQHQAVEEGRQAALEDVIEKAQLRIQNAYPITSEQFESDRWDFTLDFGDGGTLVCSYHPNKPIETVTRPYSDKSFIPDEKLADCVREWGVPAEEVEKAVLRLRMEFDERAKKIARRHLYVHLVEAIYEGVAELYQHLFVLTEHTLSKPAGTGPRLREISESRNKDTRERVGIGGAGRFFDKVTFAIEYEEAVARIDLQGKPHTKQNIAKEMGYSDIRGFTKILKSLDYKFEADGSLSLKEELYDDLLRQKRELELNRRN